MDPETIRIIKMWKGKPRSLSVRVALWEAARDVLGYFQGVCPKVDFYPQEIHLLIRENTPAECKIIYVASGEVECIKLNQFIRALGRNNIGARQTLLEIGGLTDPWDQKTLMKLELSMTEIMTFVVLNKKEGISWDELMSDLNKSRKPTSAKPK